MELDTVKQALDSQANVTLSFLASLVEVCQNLLVEPYVQFLASDKSQRFLKELGVGHVDLLSCTRPVSAADPMDTAAQSDENDDDWAAGW